MKVPYEELLPFKRELSELRLELLFWNWNCVSASICKEIMDKNVTKGVELQGNERVDKANYIDPKRRAIVLGIMHILRPARRTYVTAWQRKILTAESSKGTENDTRRPSIPPQMTARGPVQVEVVRRREKPERRVAKRRRVVSDDEGDLALEVRRTETEVDVIRQSRTRARPKKRANRKLVAAEVLDSSIEKTVAPIVSTPKVAVGESTQPVGMEGSSGVLIKVPAEALVEPLKEGMEIVDPNSLSSE
ncbi:hypothetical protein AXG93_4678s1010 [Marchantia polymorpha subsp. ruderalis]|uniref:Uncharacterized protein n=1 Tax=Marchantia polymorpha subsp. ruderalis TaxID=1480154 RepID=A0A176WIR3_MARPO|nr:hypothetical protein AXG93_4678s1010 [Marchantia polymorpha subsp. ruderalis]